MTHDERIVRILETIFGPGPTPDMGSGDADSDATVEDEEPQPRQRPLNTFLFGTLDDIDEGMLGSLLAFETRWAAPTTWRCLLTRDSDRKANAHALCPSGK